MKKTKRKKGGHSRSASGGADDDEEHSLSHSVPNGHGHGDDGDGDGGTVAMEEPVNAVKAEEVDYGYPRIHSAFRQFVAEKKEECSNPTQLIPITKHSGITGVSFAKCNRYVKAKWRCRITDMNCTF